MEAQFAKIARSAGEEPKKAHIAADTRNHFLVSIFPRRCDWQSRVVEVEMIKTKAPASHQPSAAARRLATNSEVGCSECGSFKMTTKTLAAELLQPAPPGTGAAKSNFAPA